MENQIQSQQNSGELSLNLEDKKFSSRASALVYQYRFSNPDQREVRHFPDVPDMDRNLKDTLAQFGIIIGLRESIDEDKRKYILFVDHSWWADLDDKCEEFVSKHLPEGKVPTHYVINKPMASHKEMAMWYNELVSIYPNIEPLEDYSNLIKLNSAQEAAESLIDQAVSLGFEPYFLDTNLDPLVEEYTQRNTGTLEILDRLEEEIVKARVSNPKMILMCRGLNWNYAAIVCAYMYYKHRIPCHLGYNGTQSFLSGVSRLLFDTRLMTVEDQVNYLKNPPQLAVSFDRGMNISYLVVLDKSKMSSRFTVSYCDAESESQTDVVKADLALKDMNVIPWRFEYDLSTKDIHKFGSEHRRVLNLFSKLEDREDFKGSLLDITNTALVELDTKKLVYVDNIDVRVPAIFIPLNKGMQKFKKTLELKDISRMYPIDILPDYKVALAPHIRGLAGLLGGANLRNLGSFYKHSHAKGYLINEFSEYTHKQLNVSSFTDYLTLGLWWKETYRYRLSISRELEKYLDPRKARRYGSFFSIFGGPFPSLSEELSIREEILKEV